jgi:hypothetical protein
MSVQDHPAYRERPQQGMSTKSKAGLVLIHGSELGLTGRKG